jgi:hypothetical protein
MKKLVLFIALACLIACTPEVKNDNSIGKAEVNAYKQLTDRLTEQLRRQLNGNQAQNEKITPIETADGIKITLPGTIAYTFRKDNLKFVKGDLNHDRKSDLVIWADLTLSEGYQTKMYFIFLQGKDGYQFFAEYKADDVVWDNCHKADLNKGIFNPDSIKGDLLIGNTDYQGNHEESYLNFSYRCATEKYKLNLVTKELKLVYQSDLLKKNDKTGVYEKVKKNKFPVIRKIHI